MPARWTTTRDRVVSGFVLRRLLVLAATIWLATTAMFLLLHASPSSPVNNLPPAVAADPEARAAVMAEKGLDRPLVEQYLAYLGDVATGDLGTSLYDGSSVGAAVRATVPVSFELGLLAAGFAIVPGALVGITAARHHGRAVDGASRLATIAAISVPSYWLAVLCLVVVGERYPDLLPSAGGYTPFGEDPLRNLQAMLLPAIVLGLGGFAMVARALRSSLVEILDGEDVRFARAMGMPERQVVRRIALRRAAPSTVTVLGLLVGGLVSGTVLVENVFQIPGLGQLMVTAFTRDDYPLALGTALATATVFLGLNLLVDLAVHALDPRARRRALPTGAAA